MAMHIVDFDVEFRSYWRIYGKMQIIPYRRNEQTKLLFVTRIACHTLSV